MSILTSVKHNRREQIVFSSEKKTTAYFPPGVIWFPFAVESPEKMTAILPWASTSWNWMSVIFTSQDDFPALMLGFPFEGPWFLDVLQDLNVTEHAWLGPALGQWHPACFCDECVWSFSLKNLSLQGIVDSVSDIYEGHLCNVWPWPRSLYLHIYHAWYLCLAASPAMRSHLLIGNGSKFWLSHRNVCEVLWHLISA